MHDLPLDLQEVNYFGGSNINLSTVFKACFPSISWHSTFLAQLSNILEPDVYCEIGIYEGETFNRVHARKLKIAVDVEKAALANLRVKRFASSSPKIFPIHGTSVDLASYLRDSSLLADLVFIDADHRKEEVIKDFENIRPYLSPRAFVLLHDTYPMSAEYAQDSYCSTSYQAISLLAEKFAEFSFVTLPVHPGLTIASRTLMLPDWVTESL